MPGPVVYIDTSEVREGALDELKEAIEESVALTDATEPQLIAYDVCLSEDGSQTTVAHVHAESDSLSMVA